MLRNALFPPRLPRLNFSKRRVVDSFAINGLSFTFASAHFKPSFAFSSLSSPSTPIRFAWNSKVLIETNRYCHTVAQPNIQTDTRNSNIVHEDMTVTYIKSLCLEDKSIEAFQFYQTNTTLQGAIELIVYYNKKGDEDSIKSALQVYDLLIQANIRPNIILFSNLMHLCNSTKSTLSTTLKLYSDIEKYDVKLNQYCFSRITIALNKSKDQTMAKKLLGVLKSEVHFQPVMLSCQSLLTVLSDIDDCMWLMDYMIQNGINFNEGCFIELIKVCSTKDPKAYECGKRIHEQLLKTELKSNQTLIHSLIQMYAKQGDLIKSMEIFESVEQPPPSLWNSVIGFCIENGQLNKALELLDKAHHNNIMLDESTYITLLTNIADIEPSLINKGVEIHQHITQHKFDSNIKIINSLIQIYNKCGEPYKALELFNTIISNNIKPNEITYTTILTTISNLGPNAIKIGKKIHQYINLHRFNTNTIIITSLIQMYNKCGEPNKSLELFKSMIANNITPNPITFIKILTTISKLGPTANALEAGKQIHQQIVQHKLDSNIKIINSLIQMYNKCGEPYKSIEVYDKMIENNITPNLNTYMNALAAISNIGPNALAKGKRIHEQIIQHKLDTNTMLLSVLIQMYNKCGEPYKSIEVYDKMIENHVTPDQITFTNIFTALSNIGPTALEKGKQIHQHIIQHKLDTDPIANYSLVQMYKKCREPIEQSKAQL